MAQASEPKTQTVVRYIGGADIRIIDKASWAQVGVEQDKVSWDASNQWTIPASSLSKEAVEYCRTQDSGFSVKDEPVA